MSLVKPRFLCFDDKSLYIYYIGRHKNELLYHYGVTTDLYMTEFSLRKRGINKYILTKNEPLDTNVYVKEHLDNFLEKHKLKREFVVDDVFTLSNNISYVYIDRHINDFAP